MLELRQNAEEVVRDLRRGQTLLLTCRGQPLAGLEPISTAAADIAVDDQLDSLAEQVETAGGNDPLAKGNARLTNVDIDRALYGS